jgi:hypothetical protein
MIIAVVGELSEIMVALTTNLWTEVGDVNNTPKLTKKLRSSLVGEMSMTQTPS